jgi:hypothetical protein
VDPSPERVLHALARPVRLARIVELEVEPCILGSRAYLRLPGLEAESNGKPDVERMSQVLQNKFQGRNSLMALFVLPQ